MVMSNDTAVRRFADGATDGGSVNVFARGDVLYSYGSHFPLAVRGVWGVGLSGPIFYLINGDKYSNTTTRHQWDAICGLKPNVQIPFSALQQVPTLWRDGFSRYDSRPTLTVLDETGDDRWNECPKCGARSDVSYTYASINSATCETCKRSDGEPVALVFRHILGSTLVRDTRGTCWLSSLDGNERTPHYFLCELPDVVATVAEAYESLKPDTVKLAEASGVFVKRQGDVFLIPAPDAKPPSPTFRNVPVLCEYTNTVPDGTRHYQIVYRPTWRKLSGYRIDSRHVASQVRAQGYATYVRGFVDHPEHKRIYLGNTWHVAVKNRAGRAFNAIGNVD